jgi:hypothetical protein
MQCLIAREIRMKKPNAEGAEKSGDAEEEVVSETSKYQAETHR